MHQLPPSLEAHIKRRFAVVVADRDAALAQAVRAVAASMSARGLLNSGATVRAMVSNHAAEVRERERALLDCLHKSLAALGGCGPDGLAQAATASLAPILADQTALLRQALQNTVPLRQPGTHDRVRVRALEMFDADAARAAEELQLCLAEMEGTARQMADKPAPPSGVTIHTGDHSPVMFVTAGRDVSIGSPSEAIATIREAMQAVLAALPQSSLPPDRAAEVKELATQCAEMAASSTPDKAKVQTLAGRIGGLIRGAGALTTAASLIERALKLFGGDAP
jgi:hypothetical protein